MAQVFINNGDSGLAARNAINGNFTQLFGSLIIPAKIESVSSNTEFSVSANCYIEYIAISAILSNPTIKIGTTPNGDDIVSEQEPGNFSLTDLQQYFKNAATLYITITGGSVNIRIGQINNFY